MGAGHQGVQVRSEGPCVQALACMCEPRGACLCTWGFPASDNRSLWHSLSLPGQRPWGLLGLGVPPVLDRESNTPLPPPGSEHQILYIADDNKIRSMFPFNPNSAHEPAFQGDEDVRIDAMDIYVKGNKIYWTNWHTGRISYRELPASSAASTAANRNRRQLDSTVTHLNVSQGPGAGQGGPGCRPECSRLWVPGRSRG